MADEMRDTMTTMVFPMAPGDLPGNPFHVETPWGKAEMTGRGNAFEKIDALEAKLEDAYAGRLRAECSAEKMREALREAVDVLQLLIVPDKFPGVKSSHVWQRCVAAEARARAALSEKPQ